MTTLTKTEAEAILERLADKTLSKGQLLFGKGDNFSGSRIEILFENGGGFVVRNLECRYDDPEYCVLQYSYKDVATGFDVKGHPILIGNVLEKIRVDYEIEKQDTRFFSQGGHLQHLEERIKSLWQSWQPLGFTSSLQEIYNRIEWRVECGADPAFDLPAGCAFCKGEPAKPSPFADLFIFLKKIGL